MPLQKVCQTFQMLTMWLINKQLKDAYLIIFNKSSLKTGKNTHLCKKNHGNSHYS